MSFFRFSFFWQVMLHHVCNYNNINMNGIQNSTNYNYYQNITWWHFAHIWIHEQKPWQTFKDLHSNAQLYPAECKAMHSLFPQDMC